MFTNKLSFCLTRHLAIATAFTGPEETSVSDKLNHYNKLKSHVTHTNSQWRFAHFNHKYGYGIIKYAVYLSPQWKAILLAASQWGPAQGPVSLPAVSSIGHVEFSQQIDHDQSSAATRDAVLSLLSLNLGVLWRKAGQYSNFCSVSAAYISDWLLLREMYDMMMYWSSEEHEWKKYTAY